MKKHYIAIMRHGNASHHADSDETRPLTSIGKSESLASFKHWEQELYTVEKLISSPYLRAQQTAAMVTKAAKKAGCNLAKNEIWESITPDGHVEAVADQILAEYQQNKQNILLVSHMPFVAKLNQYLQFGKQKNGHEFTTGQIVILYFEDLPLPGCCNLKSR
jgi:phosphohistidine phosphatase